MKRFHHSRQFKKQYQKLPEKQKKKLNKQLTLLATYFQHPSLNAKKMSGKDDVWEARVDYHYRFTFEIENDIVKLRSVGTHDIYRK